MAAEAHSDAVHVINNLKEFNELAAAHKYLILDFTAVWCPPCKIIKPIFERLAREHTPPGGKGPLAFATVDVDEATDVARKFEVSAMPTFIFAVNGEATGVDVLTQAPPLDAPSVLKVDDGSGRLKAIQGANPPALYEAVKQVAKLAKAEGGAGAAEDAGSVEVTAEA
ncbi:thioredoxin-like protein [Dichotomopilus funicola]|uniref:Thioredoxin-like protein n=1 Tax=Dichotomopilus funicola TaxID=1934379 RepID=A0AAN6UYH5_9PEZI|nr:thioredoxin-like protein [Dichotomopilus funicola]